MSPSRRLTGPHPTLATVAEQAGVSRQTVSNALNNPELLREDTLARVQAVIDELGYTPNRAARQLRTRASHMIGLRFEPAQEGTSNALIDRFVHTLVEATARDRPPHPAVLRRSRRPARRVRRAAARDRGRRVRHHRHLRRYAAGRPAAPGRAPFVTFGRPWDDPSARHPWVDVDGARGAELATEHLLEAGHQRVAWLGWEKASRIGEDRRSGWVRASPLPASTPPDSAYGSPTTSTPRGWLRTSCSRTPRSPGSPAPATPSPSVCCTPLPNAA